MREIICSIGEQELRTPAGIVNLATGEVRPPMDSAERLAPTTAVDVGAEERPERFLRWVVGRITGVPVRLQWFFSTALTGRHHRPMLMVGAPGIGDELTAFVEILAATLGDYAGVVPMEWWGRWPKHRERDQGKLFYGRRVMVLEPPEDPEHFPARALACLLCSTKAEFYEPWGWVWQTMPQAYILPGRLFSHNQQAPSEILRRAQWKLPPPLPQEGPGFPEPGLFLPHEAPAILRWMLHKPTREEWAAGNGNGNGNGGTQE